MKSSQSRRHNICLFPCGFWIQMDVMISFANIMVL